MRRIKFNGRSFECPNCGPVDCIWEFDRLWICFELKPSPENENTWEYVRLEERDSYVDMVEYECPKCGSTFDIIVR
ncbi:MAG: hypothetical protein QW304_07675 [Thermoproteota archaeon]